MTRIFTKRFFQLNTSDQAAAIEAVLADIEKNCGRFPDPEAEKRATTSGRSSWFPKKSNEW